MASLEAYVTHDRVSIKSCPKALSDVFCSMWQKCNELRDFIKDWSTAIVVSIYNHSDMCDKAKLSPSNPFAR